MCDPCHIHVHTSTIVNTEKNASVLMNKCHNIQSLNIYLVFTFCHNSFQFIYWCWLKLWRYYFEHEGLSGLWRAEPRSWSSITIFNSRLGENFLSTLPRVCSIQVGTQIYMLKHMLFIWNQNDIELEEIRPVYFNKSNHDKLRKPKKKTVNVLTGKKFVTLVFEIFVGYSEL